LAAEARSDEDEPQVPRTDPLLGVKATPSMKATRKYFFVVIGLMLLQIAMGVDHRALRGRRAVVLRHAARAGAAYVVSRTIHTQIGIFWIATAWLATGCTSRRCCSDASRSCRSSASTRSSGR
jgi:nitric oxide reductase subunit B